MRYRLRTLLIVLAIGPMMLAVGYWAWRAFDARWRVRDIESYHSTGEYHTEIMYLPAAKAGYHWRQGIDGAATEVPDDPK